MSKREAKGIGEIYDAVEKADKDRIADKVRDWLKLSLRYSIDSASEYRKFVDTCYMISEGSPSVLRDKEILRPLIEIASANEVDGYSYWRFEIQKKAFKASGEALNYHGRDSFDDLEKKFLNAIFENPTAIGNLKWPSEIGKDKIKNIDLKAFYSGGGRDLEDIQYVFRSFLDNEKFFKDFNEDIEYFAEERPDLFTRDEIEQLMTNMTDVSPETAENASRILKKIIKKKGEECFSNHYRTLWAAIDIRDSSRDDIKGRPVPGEIDGIRVEYSDRDYYSTVERSAYGNILDILNLPFEHYFKESHNYSKYYDGRMDQISYIGDIDGKVERIYSNYLEKIDSYRDYYGEDMSVLFSHFHHKGDGGDEESWRIIEDLADTHRNGSIFDFAESLEGPIEYYLVNYIEKGNDPEKLGKLFSVMTKIVEHQGKSDKILEEKQEVILDIWEHSSNKLLINELSKFILTLSEFSNERLIDGYSLARMNGDILLEAVKRIDTRKFEDIIGIIEKPDLGGQRKVSNALPILLKLKLEQDSFVIPETMDERFIENNIENQKEFDQEQKIERRLYFSMLPILAEKSGDLRYIDLAKSYLRDEDKFVKVKCLEAISKSGHASKEDIEPLMEDDSPEVRKMANRASRKISEDSVNSIEELKGAENVEIKSDGDVILGGSKSEVNNNTEVNDNTDNSTEVKDSVLNRSNVEAEDKEQ